MSGFTEGPASDAGWFPDPAGSTNVRWWDGSAWTDHLIDPATGAAPVAAAPMPHQPELPASTAATSSIAAAEIAPSGQPLTRRELREQEASVAAPASAAPAAAAPVAEPQPAAQQFAQSPVAAAPVEAAPIAQAPVAPPSEPQAVRPPVQAQPMSSFDLLMSPPTGAAAAAAVPAAPAAESQPTFQQPAFQEPAFQQPAFQQPSFQQQDAQPTTFPPAGFPAAFPPAVPGPDEPWVAAPVPQVSDLFPARDEPANQPFFNPTAAAPAEVADDENAGSVSTFGIWLFAALPILHFALIWYVYQQLTPTDGSSIRWVVVLGPIVVYLIFAMLDRSRLVANGHESVPSPLFAIIPPIYLAFRVTRLGLGAIAPALVWLVLQVAAVVALIVFFPSIMTHLTS